jgi:hypothetical protein
MVLNVISLQVQNSGYCQSRGQNALGVGSEKVGPAGLRRLRAGDMTL